MGRDQRLAFQIQNFDPRSAEPACDRFDPVTGLSFTRGEPYILDVVDGYSPVTQGVEYDAGGTGAIGTVGTLPTAMVAVESGATVPVPLDEDGIPQELTDAQEARRPKGPAFFTAYGANDAVVGVVPLDMAYPGFASSTNVYRVFR